MAMQVEELDAVFGKTQRFECQVVGFPTPTITWYKDEIEISDNIRYEIDYNEEHGTIALIIRNVTLSDEGLYQCRAENSEGCATTTAFLVVKVDTGAGSAMDYSSMTIENVSEEEHSQVEVLKTGHQTIIEEIITRVEESEREEIEEKSFAPKITYDEVFAQDLRLKMGATIAFEVTVRGYPRPAITWFHEGTKLEDTSRISVDAKDQLSFLKVRSATVEDAGLYKVQAENSVGLDTASFRVVVKAPPSVPQNLCVVEISKDYVILSWEAPKYDGGEKLSGYEIEKSLDGMVFVSAGFVDPTVLRHKIMRLKEGAEYIFRVSAENRIGLGDPVTLEQPVVCKLPFDPPTQPRNLKVIEYNKDFITIEWTAPEFDGGSTIIQYIIEKCDVTRGTCSWTVAGTVGPNELVFRASRLFQGNLYQFRVQAENQVGPGPATELSAPVMAKLPYDKPQSPQKLKVTEVDSSSVTLSWKAPVSDGGSSITGYLVERRDSKRDDFVFVANVEASVLWVKVPRLVEGNEYYFRVFAENQVGLSAPCEVEKAVKVKPPHETPGSPRSVRVKEYWSDTISIVWDAPEFDGGSPLTGYIIEQRDTSGDKWVKVGVSDVDNCQFRAQNLISGNEYLFRVFAVNKLGSGAEAGVLEQPCTPKMPFDPPFVPLLLEVTDFGTNHVTLSWRAPEHDGGSPITGYVVEQQNDLVGMWTLVSNTVGDVTRATIAGLYEGVAYLFRVAALNKCGRGLFAEINKPVTTLLPCSKPSKPLNLKVLSAWSDYVIIGWDEPSDDGGSSLTGFTVEQRDVEDTGYAFVATIGGNVLQHQITNLLEGHEYYFRVFSQNSVGLSDQPAELILPVKACVPRELPPPPVNVRVTDTGDGTISIAWDAPKVTEITRISSYMVETCLSISTNWRGAGIVDGSATTFNLTGLVEGDYYFVRVFSENEAGRSKRPAEICEPIRAKQPSKVPCSPSNLRVTEVTRNSVTILWDMPKFDGASDPTQHVVDMREVNETEYQTVGRVDGRLNCFTMELSDKDKQYYFRVRSKNSAGYCETAAELDLPVELKDLAVKPFPPENFKFSEISDHSINLSWNSTQEPKRFIIEQRDGLDGLYFMVTRPDGKASSATIDNLLPNQTYSFRIWAENESGRSNDFSEITRKSITKQDRMKELHDNESLDKVQSHDGETIKLENIQETLFSEQSSLTASKEFSSKESISSVEQTESGHTQRIVEKKILQDESFQSTPLQLTKIKLVEETQIMKPVKKTLTELEPEKSAEQRDVKDLERMRSVDETLKLKLAEEKSDLMKKSVGEEKAFTVEGRDVENELNKEIAAVSVTENQQLTKTSEMNLAESMQNIDVIPRKTEPSGIVDHDKLETVQSLLVNETEQGVKQVAVVQNELLELETAESSDRGSAEGHLTEPIPSDVLPTEVKQSELPDGSVVEQGLLINLDAINDEVSASNKLKQEVFSLSKDLESLDLQHEEQVDGAKLVTPKFVGQVETTIEPKQLKSGDENLIESSDLKLVESADSKVADLTQLGITNVNQVEQSEQGQVQPKSVLELEQTELVKLKSTEDTEVRKAGYKCSEQAESLEIVSEQEEHLETTCTKSTKSTEIVESIEQLGEKSKDTKHQQEKNAAVEVDQELLIKDKIVQQEVPAEGILDSPDHPNAELITLHKKEQGSDLNKQTEYAEEEKEILSKLPTGFSELSVSEVNVDSVTLNWKPPLECGGIDIISYIIVMRDSSKNKYKKIGQTDGSTFTYLASNLKEGRECYFRVFAENKFGISEEFAEMKAPVKTGKRKKEKTKVKHEEVIQQEPKQEFSREESEESVSCNASEFSLKKETTEMVTTVTDISENVLEIENVGIPLIHSVPKSIEVKEGEAINIPCQVKGLPQPELKFYKDDEILKLRKKDKKMRLSYDVTDDVFILEISNSTAADAGIYRIEAINKLGSTEATVTVIVVQSVESKGSEGEVTDDKVSVLLPEEIPGLQVVKEQHSTEEPAEEVKGELNVSIDSFVKQQQALKSTVIENKSEIDSAADPDAQVGTVQVKCETESKKTEIENAAELALVHHESDLKSVTEAKIDAVQARIESELKSFTEAARTETIQAVPEDELRSISVSETKTEAVEMKTERRQNSEAETKIEEKFETEQINKTELETKHKTEAEFVQLKHESNLSSEAELKSEMSAKSDIKDSGATETSVQNVTETCSEIALKSKVEAESEAEKIEKICGNYSVEEISGNLPAFDLKPEPVTISVGETIQLLWKLSTDSVAAEIEWHRNGKKLKTKKDKRMKLGIDEKTGNNFLMISEANLKDIGQYELKVNSEFGSIVQSVFVNVVSKPEGSPPMFEEYPKPQVVSEGEAFEIACRVSGEPPPTIQFLKNGELIKVDKETDRLTFLFSDKTFKLQVKDADLKDSGEYTVSAVNAKGKALHSILVDVRKIDSRFGEDEIFLTKLVPQKVRVGEDIKLDVALKESKNISVSWFKDGRPPISDKDITIGREENVYFLEIRNSSVENSGEYTCTANGRGGACFCSANVVVAATQYNEISSSLEGPLTENLEVLEKLPSDNQLLSQYTLRENFHCKEKDFHLLKGDIVEVLDMEKKDEWLVRMKKDKEKVCFVPIKILSSVEQDRSEKGKYSSDEETEETTDKVYPHFMSVTDYISTEEKGLNLEENEVVEVLSSKDSNNWLCQKLDQPQTQGWVPAHLLVAKSEATKLDTRSTQEVFRDDVIKIANKQQEAIMKRRYTLKDLWESERDYVRDLNFILESYHDPLRSNTPNVFADKMDIVFSSVPKLTSFHNRFLDDLMNCTNDPDSLADCFLNVEEEFQLYVPYLKAHPIATKILKNKDIVKFLKDYDVSIGNVGEHKLSLPDYLQRPSGRLNDYSIILKDFMRYTARAGQSCSRLEQAVVMIESLRKKAEDQLLVDSIINFDKDLAELGPLLNHEMFTVSKGESAHKTKEYHIFLFKKKILLTKKRKSDQPAFDCKTVIDISDVLLNDLSKDKKFELCFEDLSCGKYTFQAKLAPVAESWCQLLATLMPKWGKKPKFTTKFEDVSCKEGALVQLSCGVYGQPIPLVTWYFNGGAISASSDYRILSELCQHTLSISNVSLDLGGEYSLKASNLHGEDSIKMTLTVEEDLVEPKFTSELHDCSILLGADAKFSCKISGKPLSAVKWYKDEVELKETDHLKLLPIDSQTQILILTQAGEADIGTYECRAVNKAGSSSSKAKLNITNLEESRKKQAPAFLFSFGDTMGIQDKELCLTVTYSGHPVPEVTWQFQGQTLTSSDEIIQSLYDHSASLKIKNIKPEHAGQYTCCLSNHHGTTEVSSVVSVAFPPCITNSLSDMECFYGKTIRLSCQFKSLPTPDVSWTLNGHEIVDSERISIETTDSETTLVIQNVVASDEGNYSCHLVNVAGESSTSAKVVCRLHETSETAPTAIQQPVFEVPLEKQQVSVGSNAEFSCKFLSEECQSVKWFKDGAELAKDDNIEIVVKGNCTCLGIRSIKASDAGSYQCTVTNSTGAASCSALLTVEVPELDLDEIAEKKLRELRLLNIAPVLPLDKPSLKEVDQNTLEVSWSPATLPKTARQTPISYILEKKDLNDVTSSWIQVQTDLMETSFLLNDFSPTKDCVYRVRASNQFGISEPSMTVTYYGKSVLELKAGKTTSHEYLPPKPPKDKPTVTELRDDALKISWLPSELPSGAAETDIWYVVERRCPPSKNWIEIAEEVKDTEYVMHDYRPEKDYMFRIRAGNDYGLSDPTMSVTLFTKPLETPKSAQKKDNNEYKSKVKPRTIWDKADVVDVIGGALTLRWKPSSLPQYALQTKIWYIVEQRTPPDADWTKIASDLTDTELRVKYVPSKDYYFRVRAANEFGIAEPSMPVMVRKKEDAFATEDENRRKGLKDRTKEELFGTRRVPDHLRVIPEFLGNTDDTQYGVEGQTSEIVLKLKGYPEPKVTWNFHNTRIEMGDKYTSSLTRAGELALQIQDFSWSDVGEYKAIIENEFGAAMRTAKIDMADPPTFLEPMKDQAFHLHQNGRLECRVQGIPYPTVKFKKDWRQVAGSYRVKVAREDFDHWSLNIQNAIRTDEGVYECIAENVAGKVYCTANVKITEKSGLRRDVKFSVAPVEDYFHIIDELGRGSYGIVRRLIDKNSGNQYAAKFLRYNDPLVREELAQELEMMSLLYHNNIVQVIDGYEDKNRLVIVMEIVTGGELFQRLVSEDSLTESEVAFYLRQLLLAVEFMHSQNVIHLDLKPENLLLSSPSSDELKVIDFGFARRYHPNRKLRVKYASPEFCSPEVAREDQVTPAADLWSVGVIAYILLTGISPFHCESARQTLLKVQEEKAEYPTEIFSELSESAKEFISRLLEKDPRRRMSATEAIEHPYLQLANHRGLGNRIGLEQHKAYMFRRKWERGVAVVRTIIQPKPLSVLLLEIPAVEVDIAVPSVPDDSDRASLTGSVQLEAGASAMLQMMGPLSLISTAPSVTGSGSSSEWGREYEDEDTWYEFSNAYQTGPDTHLFPSKDTGLSLRMAKYRRSSHSTSTSRGSSMRSMKERRDLRDLDKELDAEDPMPSRVRSLWHRKSIMTASSEGCPPIFKEKIRDKAYSVGDPCTLKVHVTGTPQPVISWYRNDELLTEGGRVRVGSSDDGQHSLTILQTKPNDFGVYKCVARNKHGTVTCRARMLCGDHPSRPGRPHVTKVSDREAFLIWEEPDSDGNSYIQAYKVDFYKPGDERWTSSTYCIDECALLKRLRPDTSYRFRVSAINKFGSSPYSWASVEIRTKKKGTASLDIDVETKRILLRSRQATSRPSPEPSPTSSPFGSTEDVFEAVSQEKAKESELSGQEIFLQETDPSSFMEFGSEVWRGRFSVVLNVKPKEGHKIRRVAKISEFNPADADGCLREYEMLKALRQEHIVRLCEAFLSNNFIVLVFEKLFGENVVRSLSLKNRYNEYTVTSIIKQVLDAVQFLHHHGIVHLNIQPDNVIMQSRRRFDVKLVDFGQSHRIATPEGVKVGRTGTAEFMAPEKVVSENVGVGADVWGIGVLAFILLSGISPFYAETEEETFSNIEHVRYDAHALYHNITKFGLKFLLQTLKRKPKSRLTVEECLDHRWLMLNQVMVKNRRQAVFSTDKLKLFLDDYITRRMRNAIPSKRLLETYGSSSEILWSNSDDEDELFYVSSTSATKKTILDIMPY